MLLIRRPTGKKSDALPTAHQLCIWCLDGDHNMLATSSQHARNITRNMYTMSGEEGGGATWKKCSQHRKSCSQHGKSVRNTMFGCWSQHARHKLVTCTLCQGWREGAQHGKRCSQHGKRCSQHEKRCSQHSQHASQHHDPTANMFPNSNRVAEKVSDPSARIGRPGASSSI
jgi:hypothetical protein